MVGYEVELKMDGGGLVKSMVVDPGFGQEGRQGRQGAPLRRVLQEQENQETRGWFGLVAGKTYTRSVSPCPMVLIVCDDCPQDWLGKLPST